MRILFITLFLLAGACLFAQKGNNFPPEKPKLVVGIVVDQMRLDYIYRYWDKFEKNGFRRLINEGTFCKNARQNYVYTQTAPGHATIYTGTVPGIHGIVSNHWFVRLKKQKLYCVEDNKVKTVGSTSNEGCMSPRNLLVTTYGDELRMSTMKKSKVYSVSLKDRASILPGGHTANGAFWFDDATGDWISSSYYMDSLPKWLTDFNAKRLSDFYLDRLWTPLLPLTDYTESLPDTNKYELGLAKGQRCFPYDLAFISKPDKKGPRNYSILKSTPFGNTLTGDVAIAIIVNENLGKDEFTDFIAISFSSTDYIGHYFGPMSVEIEDTYLRLDKEIAHFLDFIDMELGKENVLIFLTADHGSSNTPEYNADNKIPGGEFKQWSAIAVLKSYLNAVYGEGEWVTAYIDQQIYLNHNLIEDSKLKLADVQDKVAQFMLQVNGVSNAITSTTLQTTSFPDGMFRLMQNGFNQKRSGDILLSLEPGWVEESDYSADHNSGYNYDTQVPLIFFGWKINRQTIYKEVFLIDIVPSLSMMTNVPLPTGCIGKVIPELINQNP